MSMKAIVPSVLLLAASLFAVTNLGNVSSAAYHIPQGNYQVVKNNLSRGNNEDSQAQSDCFVSVLLSCPAANQYASVKVYVNNVCVAMDSASHQAHVDGLPTGGCQVAVPAGQTVRIVREPNGHPIPPGQAQILILGQWSP